jgi:hypothetical protein
LDALEGRAALLAEVCAAVPPGVRGAHDWGARRIGVNEMLIHTSDIAAGLGARFDPRREVKREAYATIW